MTSRSIAICALCYAAVLCLTISGGSLWTDEAFSAWLASHESFRSLSATLLTGGASDLQMAFYYIYLFFWSKLFGTSEIALRAANIPFVFLFSFALVWSSWRLFKSRVAWLAAGMLPFVWHYASEARPYMAILAVSTAGLASLIGFLKAGSPAQARTFPWICLSCLVLGSLLHMMFLLVAPPMVLMLALGYRPNPRDPRWRCWAKPLAVFSLPLCALAFFFVFTFHRGEIDYNYPPPGVKQIASVAYELAGLAGFGPNRKFSVDFHGHVLAVVSGGLAIFAGAACAIYALTRGRPSRTQNLLWAAAAFGCGEAAALSFLVGKQFDARHLAALVPLFMFLLMDLPRASAPRASAAALVLLGGTWLVSDLRARLLPEYQKEDYRDAVSAVASIRQRTGAEIAVAADPTAAAYYGLDVRGPAPCYPILQACGEAFNGVPWRRVVPALDADHWTLASIQNWLDGYRARGAPVAVLLRMDHSHRRDSEWWPALAGNQPDDVVRVHGFEIVVLKNRLHS